MKGRSKEDIEKSIIVMKNITMAMCPDEDLGFINTEVTEVPPYDNTNEAVWYLGKSIELMSQCDLIVIPDAIYEFKGCMTERDVAYSYGIRVIELPIKYVCPDVVEKRIAEAADSKACCACPNY